ncbi:MAG: hypothetical protein U0234_22870 [Sandaracinus sp.]
MTPRAREAASSAALPSCFDVVDAALIDAAVGDIAAILEKDVSRGAERVGAYVLSRFYGDDPALYASRAPRKHASLRGLLSRCDRLELPVSKTYIANAIGVAVVTRQLPANASFHRLPLSHRIELLRLRDPNRIELVASEALDARVAVRQLREEVRAILGAAKHARPATPMPLRVVAGAAKALRVDESPALAFGLADVEALREEERDTLRHTLEEVAGVVASLRMLVAGPVAVPTSGQSAEPLAAAVSVRTLRLPRRPPRRGVPASVVEGEE